MGKADAELRNGKEQRGIRTRRSPIPPVDALLAGTRAELQGRLRVDRSEFDSIVRLIRSNFEVSVRRLLR